MKNAKRLKLVTLTCSRMEVATEIKEGICVTVPSTEILSVTTNQ